MIIIICIHNALRYVKKCLESVYEYTNSECKILIIDDASESRTAQYLEFFCAKYDATLIRNYSRLGYTKSVNNAMKLVTTKYFVVLNSDTIVTKNWLQKMQEIFNKVENLGIVSPLSNAASFQSFPEVYDKNWVYAVNKIPLGFTLKSFSDFCEINSLKKYPQVDFINGFCMMFKTSVVKTIGFFDEILFPQGYGEEVDYCLRLKQAGFSIRVADDTYVYHYKSKSFGSVIRNDLAKKGRQVLYQKYGEIAIESAYAKMRANKDLENIRLNLMNHINENKNILHQTSF